MTELGASARALIAAARDGLGPDPAAIARMRAGIASATAVVGGATAAATHGATAAATHGGAAVGASTGATASVAAATGASAAIVKIAIVAVVAIAATSTAVGIAVHRRDIPTVVAAPPLTVPTTLTADSAASGGDLHVAVIVRDPDSMSAPAASGTRTLAVQRPAAGQLSDSRTADSRTADSRTAGARTDASRTAGARTDANRTAGARTDANRTADARTANSPTPAVDLAREVALLDPAMKALRRGDPAAALAAVDDYEREVGDRGQLAEDAAALALEALCASGAPADQRAAIEQRWPNAAQRRRVRTACTKNVDRPAR